VTAAVAAAGVWLVDKPAGPTSHDVVAAVRRRLGRRVKVGHAGTLDPFATGLLVVLVGRATRLAPFISDLDKTYVATVALGAVSATGDPEGPITPGGPPPGTEAVAAALATFVGTQRQRVPALSAVKVDGERLYRRTRRGEDVAAPEREVRIDEATLLAHHTTADPPLAVVQVRCSKGTYLRQLAVDLGERLGCGAYCAALRRTAVGHLDVADAVPPSEVSDEGGVGVRAALGHLPARQLTDDEARAVAHGRPVPGDGSGPVVLMHDGEALAVAQPDGAGLLRPAVVLAPQEAG
jgi:tRNA pseudouridine55 synthase